MWTMDPNHIYNCTSEEAKSSLSSVRTGLHERVKGELQDIVKEATGVPAIMEPTGLLSKAPGTEAQGQGEQLRPDLVVTTGA